jgi:hypothetical protein
MNGPKSMRFDSIRRDVTTVWNSLDPEYTKAKRGWLALQGARGVAQFNWRGIGIPQATGRPKLDGYTLAQGVNPRKSMALSRITNARYGTLG